MSNVKMQFFMRCSFRFLLQLPWRVLVLISCSLILVTGCTSLGHEARTLPQIERQLAERPNEVAVVGSGELVIAVELMLVSHGVNVYASPMRAELDASSNTYISKAATRYVVNATSTDLDMCLPEGSRQMHFHISVVDLVENQRVFAMSGDYGCKDTIVDRFKSWFFP